MDRNAVLHHFMSFISTETAEGTMKMHSFPQRAHRPIWLCMPTFLCLCTVLCFCVITAYWAACSHRNVSHRRAARCVCDATHKILWHKKAAFFKLSAFGVISYFYTNKLKHKLCSLHDNLLFKRKTPSEFPAI